jgi:transcriptional regulator with XRE-family HTH domain
MKFNEYTKQQRIKYFKNLEKFCKIIGVEKSMWRKIERGINPPPRKTLLKKFANLTHMLAYEEAQMYELARRWTPSEDTNTTNHILLSEYSKAEWRQALIQENTPDYEHKFWGKRA